MTDVEYPCPECGRVLMEEFGTDPDTGQEDHVFQCFGSDCHSLFEADEIVERGDHHPRKETGSE